VKAVKGSNKNKNASHITKFIVSYTHDGVVRAKFDGFAERCYEVNSDIWTSKVFLDIETLSLVGHLNGYWLTSRWRKTNSYATFPAEEEGERELLLRSWSSQRMLRW